MYGATKTEKDTKDTPLMTLQEALFKKLSDFRYLLFRSVKN